MSFFSDLFEGNFSKLGTDITHAPSSLMNHPSELYETLGGLGALATGGLALGALLPEAGAAALPELGLGAGGDVLGFAAPEAASAAVEAPAQSAIDALIGSSAADTAPLSSAFADPTLAAAGGGGGQFDVLLGSGLNTPTASGASLAFGDPIATTVSDAPLTSLASGGGDAVVPIESGAQAAAPAGLPAAAGVPGAAPASPGWFGPGSVMGDLGIRSPLQAAGLALGAGGLGLQMLRGQQPLREQAALEGEASQMSAQGQQMMSYLRSGKLPPGLQNLVNQQTNAAKAMAISAAARMGQSTDPAQNSQLASQITLAQQQATMQVALIAENLFKMGMNETQVAAEIQQYLAKLDYQQTQDMGKAIMNFATAMSGGGMYRMQPAAA